MNAIARAAILMQVDQLLREHCSNFVLVAAFMAEEGYYDDTIVHIAGGSLHGNIGLVDIVASRLADEQANRDEEEEEA